MVRQSSEENERCYSELRKKVLSFKFAYEQAGMSNPPKSRFQGKLRLQYMEVLNTRLLEYWATSRFTPNANMPVNVISLNLNSSGKIDFFTPQTSSNPSYSLRDAIAQYAPGNSVVVDGVTYVVRGIEYTNINQNINTFKTIYRNDIKTVIDDPDSISSRIPWRVNNKEGLELIQPVGFLPDINEDGGRVLENNKFTRVSAQLIDTDEWNNIVKEPLLFSVRKNLNTGNAKILYYNEGVGFGYCMCTRCGRLVIEDKVAESTLDQLPIEFNQIRPIDSTKNKYHLAISGKDSGKACSGSNSQGSIRRNVIIGDLIQTDYSEIRIRQMGENKWISKRTNNENLLYTLGIVFCQSLVETFGKERGAVDFTIMPNAHICIFDTNPGGAGYANQLADYSIMKQIIDNAKHILLKAQEKNSKELLLDKFTLRYQKYIDVEAALEWIENEQNVREIIPLEIEETFPKNQFFTDTVNLSALKVAFENSVGNLTLFALNDYKNWDYNRSENGWFGQLFNHFSKHPTKTTFCIIENTEYNIPEPILDMIRSINGWTSRVTRMSNPFTSKNIYPLAYVDGRLYFTNDEKAATLDCFWASGEIFSTQFDDFSELAPVVDTTPTSNTYIFKLSGDNYKTIKTQEYGKIIQNNSNGIIDNFIAHCLQDKSVLEIKYQDEHLKSVLGIITTLQIIEHIVKQTECDFKLEFLIEKYYENKDDETNITKNLPSDRGRDHTLEVLTSEWLNVFESDQNIEGELVSIVSKERRTLTHWRVLSISCGSKTLNIYPDGGFINGWIMGKNTKYYDINNTTTEDNISLQRVEDIKFDVCLENTED